jgi:magnesium transporter
MNGTMNANSMETADLASQLHQAFAQPDPAGIASLLDLHAEPDLAMALTHLPRSDAQELLASLAPEKAAAVFAHLPAEFQTECLESIDPVVATRLIAELSYDDATAVLEALEDAHAQSILAALPSADQQALHSLLAYPEESAGRLMTPEFVVIRPEWTVIEALDHLREHGELAETVNTIFVVTLAGCLLGWIRLKELLLSRPALPVERIYHRDFVSIDAWQDREEAANRISHYDLDVLPVLDGQGAIVGIITVDDVLDVMRAETTEDFHRMAAVGDLPLSLRDASMGLLYRKRIGWLVILVAVNLLSGTAIAFYETSIQAVVALVFFLPMVIASGGNAGAQAATLMVRAMATGDIQIRDWLRLGLKEISVATALGIAMALAIWLAGSWLGTLELANAIALAMFLVVVFGSLFGMLLPFILMRAGLDPATASAPLITSVVDVVGIVIYFGVATTLLQHPLSLPI